MPEDYLSFEDVLKDLQLQEAQLSALVAQGKLRAFRDGNTLKFRRTDVEAVRGQIETRKTLVLDEKPGAKPTTRHIPRQAAPQPLAEEPIDLLADEGMDFSDTADTIIGTGPASMGDTDLTLEPERERPARDTKLPTIELDVMKPAAAGTGDTDVPTVEVGTTPTQPGSDTEVPTMVIGLEEYEDTQVPTEDVATEEVFLQEGELEEAGGAEAPAAEEPTAGPEEEEEAKRAVGKITGSSSFGTGEPLAVREEPSPLFTAMCGIASFFLLVPVTAFVYCLLSKTAPKWGAMESIMRFFCEKVLHLTYIP